MQPRVHPPRVPPGGTFGVVASSSPAKSPAAVERGVRRLRDAGYQVRFLPHSQAAGGYVAGTPRDRAADLHEAFADPEINAVLQLRGGYGAVQLLELLDWQLLHDHPKPLIGSSDTTVLHVALRQRTGLVTLWGPGLEALGSATTATWQRFLAAVRGDAVGPLPAIGPAPQRLRPGVAVGELAGGTTSLVASLLGTPWQLQARSRVLLLEDVNEAPYRLDRLLTQLRQSGTLSAAAGVVFGEHVRCGRPGGGDAGAILRDIAAALDVPILAGLALGHGRNLLTVPLGVPVRLDADAGELTVLDAGLLP